MAGLPYLSSPGNIDRALNGIKQAAVPERVSQDFVKTILKIPGGSGDQMTSFLKKLGFAGPDGAPTELYKKFRNPAQSGAAVAVAIKAAYRPLYIRNEFMHELADEALLGLITEETGQAHDSVPVKLMCACIKHLKSFADFQPILEAANVIVKQEPEQKGHKREERESRDERRSIGLNLGYTINLNLPATSDSAVFDAIFKSLKENLLRADDA